MRQMKYLAGLGAIAVVTLLAFACVPPKNTNSNTNANVNANSNANTASSNDNVNSSSTTADRKSVV